MKLSLNILAILVIFLLTSNMASAVVVNSVIADTFVPGQEGKVRIEIENILNDDVEDLSLFLKFTNLPFIPIGTSEQSIDEIKEDEDEDFVFTFKASSTIAPGDYEIPYTIEYKIQGDEDIIKKDGSLGVKVKANPVLSFTTALENPVEGRRGTITLKIVNKGFSDARFVSVRILPEDFTVLSGTEVYIGEIESDDFETVTFNVIFNKISPNFQAIIEYLDFDNQKVIENLELPLTVYSQKRALEIGIIQPSNTTTYLLLALTLVLLIIFWRIFRKRQRLKRSQILREGR